MAVSPDWRQPTTAEQVDLLADEHFEVYARPDRPAQCRNVGPWTGPHWGREGWERLALLCTRPAGHDGEHQHADRTGPICGWDRQGAPQWGASKLRKRES